MMVCVWMFKKTQFLQRRFYPPNGVFTRPKSGFPRTGFFVKKTKDEM